MSDLPADSRLWPCYWWITASVNPTALPEDLVDKWQDAGREVFHGTWADAVALCRVRLTADQATPVEPPKAAPEPKEEKSGQLVLF